jgi:hypothetical protein
MGWQQRSRTEWQRLVAGWPRSGLTQDAYCARQGISAGSLQRWRNVLAQDLAPHTISSAKSTAKPRSTAMRSGWNVPN